MSFGSKTVIKIASKQENKILFYRERHIKECKLYGQNSSIQTTVYGIGLWGVFICLVSLNNSSYVTTRTTNDKVTQQGCSINTSTSTQWNYAGAAIIYFVYFKRYFCLKKLVLLSSWVLKFWRVGIVYSIVYIL